MADYYPLIARAVAGLEKNTGEARRTLYERARKALVDQLRSTEPALNESEITRERLALEEAIRKVEAESARQSRLEPQAPPAPRPAGAEAREAEGGRREDVPKIGAATARREREKPAAAAQPEPVAGDRSRPEPVRPEAAPRAEGARLHRLPRNRGGNGKNAAAEETGLKGFRDVVAEAETLGGATAQASKSAREKFAAVPSPGPEFERIEPHHEPEGLRPTRDLVPSHVRESPFPVRSLKPAAETEDDDLPMAVRPRPQRQFAPEAAELEESAPFPSGRVVRIGVVAALVLAFVGTTYWQRANISALFGRVGSLVSNRQAPPPAPEAAPAARPKIADRIGPSTQPEAGQAGSSADQQSPQQVAPVAQRVVLYEEDPGDPAGKRFVGSVIWRTETAPPSPGQPPELGVRADVEIPERRMTLTWSLRRNSDKTLPASHTVEIMFSVPADFPHGGIANVPGLLMKQAEQTRGVPLAGLAVKVTTGFFLIGLSAVDADMQRNVALLKDRSWFDIPLVYNDGRRAILAVEKGTPGERAFQEAFAAWGE